jgi:hypothetical protein
MFEELRKELVEKYHQVPPDCQELVVSSDEDLRAAPSEMVVKKDFDHPFQSQSVETGSTMRDEIICEISGVSLERLKELEKSAAQKRDLKNFLDLATKDRLPNELQKSFRLMEKTYARIGSLTESMCEVMSMFEEHFSAGDKIILEKAIAALDLPVFLKILAGGMQKATA